MTAMSRTDEPEQGEDLADALVDLLQRVPRDEALALIVQRPADEVAAALVRLEDDRLEELLPAVPPERLVALMAREETSDAVDLLQRLPAQRRAALLERLPVADAARLRRLLGYPHDSAGGRMSDRFLALRDDLTVEQARASLVDRGDAPELQGVFYGYVVDATGRLVGVTSMRDLLLQRGERRLVDLMDREVKRAHVVDDVEALARRFEEHRYLALPVVDADERLVGVIRASDALAIAREESTEDMQLMVGLPGDERTFTPWAVSVRRRLPWLVLNVGTAMAAAATIGAFEETIAAATALVVFLPVISSQGGNAGLQTLTVTLRDLALGVIDGRDAARAVGRASLVATVNGAVVGTLIGAIGWLWKRDVTIALLAGAATLLNQVAAAVAGILLPLGLRWLRMDPALASSILLTTIADIVGFVLFLGMASWLL
ncbi:MAG: magnesium transporter [Planctomycetes bacterium]|nr:magnesium transporter [Planctomycetota bacterium]